MPQKSFKKINLPLGKELDLENNSYSISAFLKALTCLTPVKMLFW